MERIMAGAGQFNAWNESWLVATVNTQEIEEDGKRICLLLGQAVITAGLKIGKYTSSIYSRIFVHLP
jgi:hypothetical protein